MLREFSQAGNLRLGVYGSEAPRGKLLRFYLGLKNASAPAQLPVEFYG